MRIDLAEPGCDQLRRLQTTGNSHKKAQKITKREAKEAAGTLCGSAGLQPRIVTTDFCKRLSYQQSALCEEPNRVAERSDSGLVFSMLIQQEGGEK